MILDSLTFMLLFVADVNCYWSSNARLKLFGIA